MPNKYANSVHTPLDPGHNYTATATAAVNGGRFVRFSAAGRAGLPSVANGNATAGVAGVAKYDAAANETVGVISGGHVGVIAGGAIAAGARVYSDANGKATSTAGTGPAVGTAYTDGVLDGVVYIQLDL